MNTTYCNPIPLPDFPRGTDDIILNTNYADRDYCSVSDPDGLYWNGRYYIYTSYKGVYSSDNLLDWESHSLTGIKEEAFYGPAVMEFNNKFYFTACQMGLYVSDNPLGPFEFLGYFRTPKGEKILLDDPDFFVDDNNRVYIFWGCGIETGIVGAELDSQNLIAMVTEPKQLIRFNPSHIWERWGEYNQDKKVGWIEGTCMIKVNGRYYLNYSGCGTTFSGYSTGVYFSDESPLSGFVYQSSNPVIRKNSGLLRGGGHSCIIKKSDDELWAFYTCPVCYSHRFERMIGMDRVTIKNGELYCSCTDIPCDCNGKARSDMLPLTFMSLAKASSCAPGRDAVYAIDDSIISHWQPDESETVSYIEVSLRGVYLVGACRIIKRDIGLDFNNGKYPRPLKYQIWIKTIDGEWILKLDKQANDQVKMVEYIEFEREAATDIKLVIKNENDIKTAIVSFTAFGECIQ